MKLALIFTSKRGMENSYKRVIGQEIMEEDDEPPPSDMYAECDSDETIIAVTSALKERWEVVTIESDEYAYIRLQEENPRLVFNIAERLVGPSREAHIPVLCEILNLPYTGSDPLTLGICLDKSRAKEILSYYGVPTAPFFTVEFLDEIPKKVTLPVIVKPLYEGSSKGVKDNSVVYQRRDLEERIHDIIAEYKQPVIVERFLTGREFTVGVVGNIPNIEILPIVEIDHSQLPKGVNPIYSFEAKWIWDTPANPLKIFECPAKLDKRTENKIRQVVEKAIKILRVKDWCRVDIRLDENNVPNILELNPLPGILPNPEDNSCLPKAARATGYSYNALIQRVAVEAMKRNGIKYAS